MRIAERIFLAWAVVDIVAAYFWFRFMNAINPLPKPRKSRAQVEREIRDFETWQAQ